MHRTGDRRLLRLFAASRRYAIDPVRLPGRKLAQVRRSVRWHAHSRRAGPPDAQTLILYRSRAEVLEAARVRAGKNLPYRLRLSGLPQLLQPWVGVVLHDYEGKILPRWQFEDLWAERVGTPECDNAWDALGRAGGQAKGQAVDIARLFGRMQAGEPPPELCLFDPGDPGGPVIGTIHASKGREAARVQLMLPGPRTGNDDPDAEARVLFVGATRARERLEVGRGLRLSARRLANGRVYLPESARSAWIEIGRAGDFAWSQENGSTSPAKAGEKFSLSLSHDRVELACGQTVFGNGLPVLLSDLGEIRTRLAGSADHRRWAARETTLPCLGDGAVMAGKTAEASSADSLRGRLGEGGIYVR